MGKILFLADIHGNMPAVRVLEKEIGRIRPDQIWFVGDAVGKGPENDQAADWVRAHCTRAVRGNWDDGICGNYRKHDIPRLDFFCDQLGEERIRWLESLPFEDEVLLSGIMIRVVHGRPTDRLFQAYDTWEQMAEGFISKQTGKIYGSYICADSHMPYIRACVQGYAVNTGSVGNSLGIPRVHALLAEGDIGGTEKTPVSFSILSLPYDNEEAAMIAQRYPELPNMQAYQNEVRTGVYSR
ncbi:MAG: metallophosphoesterase family protein [Clostridia bacterium]|nr:metallophosphoesterase family protein [Clostridia bacterium]